MVQKARQSRKAEEGYPPGIPRQVLEMRLVLQDSRLHIPLEVQGRTASLPRLVPDIQPSHTTSPIRRSLSFFGSVEAEPGASLADFSLDRVVPVMIQSREPSPASSVSSFGEGKVWEQARSPTEILSGSQPEPFFEAGPQLGTERSRTTRRRSFAHLESFGKPRSRSPRSFPGKSHWKCSPSSSIVCGKQVCCFHHCHYL
uniref:Uncharacterized protein n=1 Tax=Eptatretus burgeri TaxID=7764 RepID=A0A8C4WW51_EPTBU